MTDLVDEIKARVRAHGPLTFAAFMHLALYDRRGYYGSGQVRTGWHGDFVTSPELDPAFGELLANALEETWTACGEPETFDVVEVGGGEGGLAVAIIRSASGPFGAALRYHLVERFSPVVARQRDRLRPDERVSWAPSLDELDPIATGCAIAHEILDNLPVHLIEGRPGGFVELFVGVEGDRLALVEGDLSSPEVAAYVERHEVRPIDGARVEVGIAAEQMIRRLTTVIGRGAIAAIDYGSSSDDLARRIGGTLATYSSGGVDDDPLSDVGSKDITTHVNWTAVRTALAVGGFEVHGPFKQRALLKALGSAASDSALRAEHRDAILRGDGAAALRSLSRRQALGALTDPGGLGGLDVMIGVRGCSPGFITAV